MVLAYRVPLMILNILTRGQSNFAVRFNPDWRVFAYLTILMVAATVLSSLMPIRAAWKLDLLTALKGREGAATVRSRTTSGLIVTQIALGFVLVCAAVIFGRMPGLIRGINPGFETHQTLTVPLRVNTSENNRAKAQVFYRALETKILALPVYSPLRMRAFNHSFNLLLTKFACRVRPREPGSLPPSTKCRIVSFPHSVSAY